MTSRSSIRVLLVEDSPTDADLLAIALEDVPSISFSIDTVETLADGLRQLSVNTFDVVLLDLNLPDSFGCETCERVHRAAPSVPIIVLTGLNDEEKALETLKVGAQDYLVKGQNDGALLARAIRYAIKRQGSDEKMRHADERLRLISEQLPAVLWTTDTKLCFTAPTTCCLLNSGSPAARVGESLLDWCRLQKVDESVSQAHQHALEGQSVALELRWRGKSLAVQIEPLRNDALAVIGTIGISFDVTQQRRMSDELTAAWHVQQALFPRSSPRVANFDIAGQVFPAEETAGDYFDFIPINNDCLGLVVGDVSGHGLGPALLTAELRAYLRLLATMQSDAAQVLMEANRLIASDLDECRFVTLFFGRPHLSSRVLEFASAGHPGYVIRESGQTLLLESTGVPLGLFADSQIDNGPSVQLAPGDILLLPTDGVHEAQNSDRKLYGVDRMLSFVHAHRHEPAAVIIDELREAVSHYTGCRVLSDDTTIVVARAL